MILITNDFVIYSYQRKSHIDFELISKADLFNEGFNDVDSFVERFAAPPPDLISMKGSIKWDGCSNWSHGDCALHFSNPEDIDKLSAALHTCYEKARTDFNF